MILSFKINSNEFHVHDFYVLEIPDKEFFSKLAKKHTDPETWNSAVYIEHAENLIREEGIRNPCCVSLDVTPQDVANYLQEKPKTRCNVM